MNFKSQLDSFINPRGEAEAENFQFAISSIYEHSEASLITQSDEINIITRTPHQNRKPAPYSFLKLKYTVKEKLLAYTDDGLSLKCIAEVLGLYCNSSELPTQVPTCPLLGQFLNLCTLCQQSYLSGYRH